MKLKVFKKFTVVNILLSCHSWMFLQELDILNIRKKYLEGRLTDYHIAQLEQCELNPKDEVLRKLILFEYYMDKLDIEKAKNYASELSSFYPIAQLVNFRLGEYFFLNNKEDALTYFESCIKMDSRFHEARRNLAQTYYVLKNYPQAYRHFNIFSWFNRDKEILKKLDYLLGHIELNQTTCHKEKKFTEIKSLIQILEEDDIPYIDVGISTKDNGTLMKIDCVKFSVSEDFTIYDENGKQVLKAEGGFKNEWKIVFRTALKSFGIISPNLNKEYRVKTKTLLVVPQSLNSSFYIHEYKWFKNVFCQGKEYRGKIIVKNLKDQIIVINKLPLEEYLYSVVPKEIGHDKPLEALKAQAVVARTVALYRKKIKVHRHFDVCSGQHCQVYGGVHSEKDSTAYAVNSTIGEVVTRRDSGSLMNIYFHANCGGLTISSENFHNEEAVICDSPEPFEANSENDIYCWYLLPDLRLNCNGSKYVHWGTFRWLRTAKRSSISKYLNEKYKIGRLKEISVVKRKRNLYISKLKIVGSEKNKLLYKEHEIRNIITNGSLRSSSFIVEYNKNTDTYYFWGAGWGHGVGMCQSGTCNLADEGKNYIDIINHYYPIGEIKKIY